MYSEGIFVTGLKMFMKPGVAVIKSEPDSPLNSVEEGNGEISLDEEDYDELSEKVTQWVWMKSSDEIFFKCEELRQENEVGWSKSYG